MDPWQRIFELAGAQFGVVSSEQLLGCGVSSSATARALRRGHLRRVHRGVFAVGHLASDPRGQLLAAALAGGEGACVSDRSAAAHLGMLKPPRGPISVTVSRAGSRKRPGLRFHCRRLDRTEVGWFDGVPCTSPSRTILDLAARDADLAARAIREAGPLGLLDLEDLSALVERRRGIRGVARLRVLLDGERPLPVFTRSELERRIYRLCEAERLPLPDMNVQIEAGGRLLEVDCAWPDLRLVIECDSAWHDNPVSAREDAIRDQDLTLAGWRVERVRWGQVVNAPARCAAQIRHLLDAQSQLHRSS